MARAARSRISFVALGAIGVLALVGCRSSDGNNGLRPNVEGGYGSIPASTGTPATGGIVTYAEQPGAGPSWIFPINDNSHISVFTTSEFQYLMYRPLYFPMTGASPVIDFGKSLASPPAYANGNKAITIRLDGRYTWSDGKPVTAEDILFTLDLSKAAVKENPANLAGYTPGEFPDNIVHAEAPDRHTVVLTLDKTYNQAWLMANELATFLTPLPSQDWNVTSAGGPHVTFSSPANAKAVYDYLYKQSATLSTYATNPLWQVVDGPFRIKSFNASTDATDLAANPAYTGAGKPKIAEIDELAYTSTAAEWNDVLSGKVDVGYVDFTDIPQIDRATKLGYAYYGLPATGWEYMVLNFKNATNSFGKIVSQLYVRQALSHLQNQDAVIKGAFKGAAVPQYSTVGSLPPGPYSADAIRRPVYAYDIPAARSLFTSHGWVNQNGTLTCRSPGTGSTSCGAGIAKGTPFTFTFYYSNSPAAIGQEVESFVSAAKQLGINITLKSLTFNQLVTVANDPASSSTQNDWGMSDYGGFNGVLYPTSDTVYNTGGSYNQGAYIDPKADALIHDSVFGADPRALVTESDYLSRNLPVIFEPNPDNIWVWKKTIQGPSTAFSSLTQYWITPEDWYLTK